MNSVRFLATDFPPEGVGLLELNAPGTRLAVSCQDAGHVMVFDPRSGEEVARAANFPRIHRIGFLSTEELLVTHQGGCLRWDIGRSRPPAPVPDGWHACATLSPDGAVLAVGGDACLLLCDPIREHVVRRLDTIYACFGYGPLCPPAFSAQGRYVAADLHGDQRGPHLVVIWDTRSGRRQRIFDSRPVALAFPDDTLTLAVSDSDFGSIHLYEPDQGEEPAVRFKVDHLALALQYRDGGRTLAVLMSGGGFVQLDTGTGTAVSQTPPPTQNKLYPVAVNADWSLFAGVTEGGVVVWPGDRAAGVPR